MTYDGSENLTATGVWEGIRDWSGNWLTPIGEEDSVSEHFLEYTELVSFVSHMEDVYQIEIAEEEIDGLDTIGDLIDLICEKVEDK